MIREIRLKNFRSHAETVVSDIQRFNMLAGPNRSGKSGIRDGILVALTGQTEVDDTGRNLDDLRTWNKKRKWGVELVLEGGEVFARTEGEGPRAQVQGLVSTRFGVSPGVIRLCLLPRAILETDPKKRQALIQEISPPARIDIPKELCELLQKHQIVSAFGEAPDDYTATVREIETYYKAAYERRTEAKRLVDAMGKAIIPDPPPGMEELADWPVERIEAGIATLSDKMVLLTKERDELASAKTAWDQRLAVLESKAADRKERLDKQPSSDEIKAETKTITAKDFSTCVSCGYGPLSQDQQDAALTVALDFVREKERLRLRAVDNFKEANNELQAHQGNQPEVDLAAIIAINQRLQNGQQKREAFAARVASMRTASEIEKRGAEAKASWEELDKLCTALGPKGLPSNSKDDANLTAFLDGIASTMRSLGFDSCDLKPLVACQDPTVRDTPVRLLSTSERICFGIAFQTAIAVKTGFDVVAVDEWEALDQEWAKVAQKILMASGCQVFVFNVLKDQEKYMAKATQTNTSKDFRLYLVNQNNGASAVTLP